VSLNDLAGDPRGFDPGPALGLPRLGPALGVPLGSGIVGGALVLAWYPEHAWLFDTVEPVMPASFAEQAALALQLARARGDQQRLAVFEDRDRIGRDLHDLVIQRLFAVGLSLQGKKEKRKMKLFHSEDRSILRSWSCTITSWEKRSGRTFRRMFFTVEKGLKFERK
jgi:hypothetical protein